MKAPRKYFEPLAIGAPRPLLELPSRLERMIHFVPPHIEKVRAKVGELAGQVDVVLGNLEDAIPIEAKTAAREGVIAMAKATDFGSTGLWVRVNALNSPWFLDDMTRLMGVRGTKSRGSRGRADGRPPSRVSPTGSASCRSAAPCRAKSSKWWPRP